MIPLVSACITDIDRTYMRGYTYAGMHRSVEVERFERAFADRVGCQWAVAVNSGTSALVVALYALGVGEGETVTVPSYSCVAVRNAVESLGAETRYMDGRFDVREARMRLWDNDPDMFLNVHMFGRETDAENWAMLDDWTLSLGGIARLYGDLGVCSTHESKMISTGRGGLIFGNDAQQGDRIRDLACYETHTHFGFSLGMSDPQAALGNSQLQQLDAFIARRRELARRYTERFQHAGIECPDHDTGSVFFRYLISVEDPAAKVESLAERGIEAGRGVNPPLHRLAGLDDREFPGTAYAVNTLLSVPVHPSISDEQADYIAYSVVEVCA